MNVFFYQDYFDIIKNPMDLTTIKKKLDKGQYSTPWDYVNDVWLMFNNAWIYNKKTSRVYKWCTKVCCMGGYHLMIPELLPDWGTDTVIRYIDGQQPGYQVTAKNVLE